MASMTPPGNSRRRMRRDGSASHSERANGERDGQRVLGRDETPEEAACAIADALDFLEQETAKAGVHGAPELIQRAAAMLREFAEAERD